MSNETQITVVVPVYNSVDTLAPLFDGIKKCMQELGKTFEVLYVDDGSAADTWKELKKIKEEHGQLVSVIRLGRNYGQNAATVCGITHAKGGIIITLDDDLQTPPGEMKKLVKAYELSGSAAIFGATSQQSNPLLKRIGSHMIKIIFNWVDGAEIGSSFRLLSPELKEKLNRQTHDQLFLNQVIHWYTDEVEKVDVVHESREEGSSGYSFVGLSIMALRLIFFYTDFPLRLMSISGLLIAAVCFAFGIYFIYEKLVFGAESGFASIITAIFFATGIIILCLSILGAYISRIYADRIRKPVYSIKTQI